MIGIGDFLDILVRLGFSRLHEGLDLDYEIGFDTDQRVIDDLELSHFHHLREL